MKRKGIKVLPALENKNLQKNQGKTTKICFDTLTNQREREKCLKSFEKVMNVRKHKVVKKLSMQFLIDQKLDLIN